jgi:hypothetical protein
MDLNSLSKFRYEKKKKKLPEAVITWAQFSRWKKLVYISKTGAIFYCFSINIPRPTANPPLRAWSASREVVSTPPTVAFW